MKLHSDIFEDSNTIKVVFEDIEECVEFKNNLIAFIKKKKREIRDKGIEPNLTFTFIKQIPNE